MPSSRTTEDPAGPRAEPTSTAAERAWPTSPTTAFRPDVEGLRILAIALVAVYHVWVGRVSGGVDVFLMISGFLVGGGLLRRVAAGTSVPLGAYLLRLVRRLLPAVLVVMAATVGASWLLLPRTRWADVAGQALASLGYVQNWWLALADQAYGGADTSASPLQHMWSLSVQGQLFVAVPVVLLVVTALCRRLTPRRRYSVLVAGTAAVTVMSFGYAVVSVADDQAWAYYDTFARAWEYLAGTLLAVVLHRVRLPAAVRTVLGWAGVAAVVLTGVLVDGRSAFPGLPTLLPILGTAAVLVAGVAPTRAGVDRVLGWGPVSSAGRYAYGLYLWHWPVLVLVLAARDREEVGWLAGTAVLLVSAALAVLTTRWVETPLRVELRPGSGRRVLTGVLAACIAVAALAPVGWLVSVEVRQRSLAHLAGDAAPLDPARHPGALALSEPEYWSVAAGVEPVPNTLDAYADVARSGADGCVAVRDQVEAVTCTYGDPDGDITLALVGGSHVEQFLPALRIIAADRGIRIVTYLKVSCPYAVDPFPDYPECGEWVDVVEDELVELRPDGVVVTSTRPAVDGVGDEVPPSYRRAFERLDRHGLTVIGIRDNPWLPFHAPDCLDEHADPDGVCSVPRDTALSAEDPTAAQPGVPANVLPLDVMDAVCRPDVCRTVEGNVLVYRDAHHLTSTYVRTLAPLLDERLGAVTGWW